MKGYSGQRCTGNLKTEWVHAYIIAVILGIDKLVSRGLSCKILAYETLEEEIAKVHMVVWQYNLASTTF